MSAELLYLKENSYFEPLINHWYAWSYLISPVQASRYIANTHKRLMTSFVNNSQLHIRAAKEPLLTGGEFLHVREDQIGEVTALIAEIDEKRRDLVELSDAVKELEELLRRHTNGESLEYLYAQVPDPLKGYLELYMDMNHNPSYRLLEKLLYRSKYYQTSLQSVSFGLISKANERPFALSTPRLPDENHIQIGMDFNAPELTTILKSRTEGAPKQAIDQIFESFEVTGGLSYKELFTNAPPENKHVPIKQGIRLRYLGHASFILETEAVSILIDPVIAARGDSYKNAIYSYSDLPSKIDYICITHHHIDHFNIETLLQLRYKTDKLILPINSGGILPDPSMKLIAEQLGFDVIAVDDFDEIQVPTGKLISIPFLGEHGDLNVRSKTVWVIELSGKRFFFGADATNCDPFMYKHVRNIVGDVDVLAIGMECVGAPYTWLYGALNTKIVSKNIKNSRRLNGSDANQACRMVDTFGAKQVYLYAMGMEPWYKYFIGIEYNSDSRQMVESEKTIRYCKDRSIPCERLFGKLEASF